MGVTRLTTANWSCVPYCRPHWPQLQPIALLADTSCNLFTRTGICRNSKHRDRLLAKVDHPSRVAQWFQSHLHLCWQQRPLASSKSLANQGRGSPDTVLKTEFGKIPRIPLMLSVDISGRQGDGLVPHSFKICKCDKSVTWPGITWRIRRRSRLTRQPRWRFVGVLTTEADNSTMVKLASLGPTT